MRMLLSGMTVLALVTGAAPAWSQLSQTEQNAPGTGGISKPGIAGVPGIESGPAAKPSSPAGIDESGVPGMPGSKSGHAGSSPTKPTQASR
jgi:hypothetical protein